MTTSTDTQEMRARVLERLLDYYEPESGCELPTAGEIKRFAVVQADGDGDNWIDFSDDAEALLSHLADEEGEWKPLYLVDLDTGEARLVEIIYKAAELAPEQFTPSDED